MFEESECEHTCEPRVGACVFSPVNLEPEHGGAAGLGSVHLSEGRGQTSLSGIICECVLLLDSPSFLSKLAHVLMAWRIPQPSHPSQAPLHQLNKAVSTWQAPSFFVPQLSHTFYIQSGCLSDTRIKKIRAVVGCLQMAFG